MLLQMQLGPPSHLEFRMIDRGILPMPRTATRYPRIVVGCSPPYESLISSLAPLL